MRFLYMWVIYMLLFLISSCHVSRNINSGRQRAGISKKLILKYNHAYSFSNEINFSTILVGLNSKEASIAVLEPSSGSVILDTIVYFENFYAFEHHNITNELLLNDLDQCIALDSGLLCHFDKNKEFCIPIDFDCFAFENFNKDYLTALQLCFNFSFNQGVIQRNNL